MNRKPAFTLNELLIVIAILVLLMGLALPAFNALTGSRSIEGATNQISAYLGQARMEAIGVQEYRGVLFFLDTNTDRINMGMVRVDRIDTSSTSPVYYLDLVVDRDPNTNSVLQAREFITLPPGIGLQTIDNPTSNSNVTNDTFIGYNSLPAAGVRDLAGGVILFDGYGKLACVPYGFRFTDSSGAVTPVKSLFETGKVAGGTAAADYPPALTALDRWSTQFGVVVYDREAYTSAAPSGGTAKDEDIQPTSAAAISGDEATREAWLGGSATVAANGNILLINRYNGTLVKGE